MEALYLIIAVVIFAFIIGFLQAAEGDREYWRYFFSVMAKVLWCKIIGKEYKPKP